MRLSVIAAIAVLWWLSIGTALAQQRHRGANSTDTTTGRPCYDPADPTEIRLWNGPAPGATGDDPCRDIPFLKMYTAEGGGPAAQPAILIIPGGGYDRLSDTREQAPVAEYFAHTFHVKAFVLYYRLVQHDGTYRYPVPMWDGRRALNLIQHEAGRYGVDPGRIGLFGFSAGGHLASTLALHPGADFGLSRRDPVDEANARPSFLGLGYPVISMLPSAYAAPNSLKHLLHGYQGSELDRLEHELSGQEQVSSAVPPVFLFESLDDDRISAQNSVLFASALHAAGVPAEIHLFKHGVHGAGLAQDVPEENAWPGLFGDWLERNHFLEPLAH